MLTIIKSRFDEYRYYIYTLDNNMIKEVGYIVYSLLDNVIETEDIIIYSKYRKKGYGSQTINTLKSMHKTEQFKGYLNNYLAANFWKNQATNGTDIPIDLEDKELDNWCFDTGGKFRIW